MNQLKIYYLTKTSWTKSKLILLQIKYMSWTYKIINNKLEEDIATYDDTQKVYDCI
jgi:hypothetical protein